MSVTEDEVETALEVFERIKENEFDDDHVSIIEEIQQQIRGIYEYRRPYPNEEKLEVAWKVLDEVDPDEQSYAESYRVKQYLKKEGMSWLDIPEHRQGEKR